MDVRYSHEIVARVADYDGVTVDIKAPPRVEAYVGSGFGWLFAGEYGVVVPEGVPWIGWKG